MKIGGIQHELTVSNFKYHLFKFMDDEVSLAPNMIIHGYIDQIHSYNAPYSIGYYQFTGSIFERCDQSFNEWAQ